MNPCWPSTPTLDSQGCKFQLAPGEYTIEAKATRQVVGNPYFDLYFDIPDTAAARPPRLRPRMHRMNRQRWRNTPPNTPAARGAVYVGDLAQLAGQSSTMEWGTTFGRVTLESLEHHLWLYESAYYQSLIEKANLTNPTELTSSGESIRLRFALHELHFAPLHSPSAVFGARPQCAHQRPLDSGSLRIPGMGHSRA